IDRMKAAGKPVGGIGWGEAVLVKHGVLFNKRAAISPHVFATEPTLFADKMGISWQKQPVVADGKVVTAAGAGDALAFADKVLELLDVK
ncbi:MAG: DJ-1/PfpI family protein, partial [Gemmataceae bacterium]|nr:DJ-1/PfpI family protein [Gemmataceae bacterium]